MSELGWRDIAALLATAGLLGGMIIAWVRWQLAGDFARRADVEAVGARVAKLEDAVRSAPTHDDVRALGDRVARVEGAVEVVAVKIEGVREGMMRVERDLSLLVQHHLRGGS